ncbi:hypothetical protein B0T13DRAFT_427889, partial [Neurospora crassa]
VTGHNWSESNDVKILQFVESLFSSTPSTTTQLTGPKHCVLCCVVLCCFVHFSLFTTA